MSQYGGKVFRESGKLAAGGSPGSRSSGGEMNADLAIKRKKKERIEG